MNNEELTSKSRRKNRLYQNRKRNRAFNDSWSDRRQRSIRMNGSTRYESPDEFDEDSDSYLE